MSDTTANFRPSDGLGLFDSRTSYLIHLSRMARSRSAMATVICNEEIQEQIGFIAKISNLAAWRALNIDDVAKFAEISLQDQKTLVTGRTYISRLEAIGHLSYVERLEVARPVKPLLDRTVQNIGLTPQNLGQQFYDMGGEGAVIGIVDSYLDVLHPSFTQNRTSRIQCIWDQGVDAPSNQTKGYLYKYGTEYTKDAIRQIVQKNTYSDWSHYHNPMRSKHGTHVSDIAGGSNPSLPGIAPKADMIFVNFNRRNKRFGDSARLIEAVSYIFERAKQTPCVVNVSLGTYSGPHNGSNPVEKAFDALVQAQPNRAIVIAAGNSYESRKHESGKVPQGRHTEITWEILGSDEKPEVQIWYSTQDQFDFQLLGEDGKHLTDPMPINTQGPIYKSRGREKIYIGFLSHRAESKSHGKNAISLFMEKDQSSRTYRLRLYGRRVRSGRFHAWIERTNCDRSRFQHGDPRYTLNSIGTGYKTIVVGSYNATSKGDPIAWSSSSGPTLDGREKPEVSAPGCYIKAAEAQSRDYYMGQKANRCMIIPIRTMQITMSGTSMAAPVVTGLIARMFGLAKQYGVNLTIDETRMLLFRSVEKIGAKNWNERYGYGKVRAQRTMEAVQAFVNENKPKLLCKL